VSRRIRLPLIRLLSVVAVSTVLAGCEQASNTGPGQIHWDRQTCEHCQMVISERRHAVQVRLLGDRRTYAFDDLGCGLLWLDQRDVLAGGAQGPEVWVIKDQTEHWIDGRAVSFGTGLTTPMAYGFGPSEGGISLAEAQIAVRDAERIRRSSDTMRLDRNRSGLDTEGRSID
jgi:copper chaperone NosL